MLIIANEMSGAPFQAGGNMLTETLHLCLKSTDRIYGEHFPTLRLFQMFFRVLTTAPHLYVSPRDQLRESGEQIHVWDSLNYIVVQVS